MQRTRRGEIKQYTPINQMRTRITYKETLMQYKMYFWKGSNSKRTCTKRAKEIRSGIYCILNVIVLTVIMNVLIRPLRKGGRKEKKRS